MLRIELESDWLECQNLGLIVLSLSLRDLVTYLVPIVAENSYIGDS